MSELTDRQLAAKMVWVAEQMKRSYQPAGLCVARVFCTERGIDPTPIERLVLELDAVRDGTGSLEDVFAALEASDEV
jgi:hypothetical protein